MSPSLRSFYEWAGWLKNFTSFLDTMAFARKFWDLGEFLLPSDLSAYSPVNVSTNLNNMFAGVSSSSATPAGASTSSAIPTGSTLTPGSSNLTPVTTVMAANHPLTQMQKMDQAVYDMHFINDFYVRVIEYILHIFKWTVSINDAALAILLHSKKCLKSCLLFLMQFPADSQMWLRMSNCVSAHLALAPCTNLDVNGGRLGIVFGS